MNHNIIKILDKLNELLNIEVHELQKYSKTSTCTEAKQDMQNEYNYHKEKVRLVSEIKHIIYFDSHN